MKDSYFKRAMHVYHKYVKHEINIFVKMERMNVYQKIKLRKDHSHAVAILSKMKIPIGTGFYLLSVDNHTRIGKDFIYNRCRHNERYHIIVL